MSLVPPHPADEEALPRAERQRARQNREFGAEPHRALPASEEAEKGTLCSILLNPAEVLALCYDRGVKPDWFHIPAHAMIYSVLANMGRDGEPIDIVTLTTELLSTNQFETCGGGSMVSGLFTYLPTAMNVEYYLQTLREKHTLREVIRVAGAAMKKAYECQDDVESVVGSLQESATRISLTGAATERSFREILDHTADRWRERKEGVAQQICTTFPRLDKLSPIRRKHTVVISGKTKSGKSALAGSIVLRVAGDQGTPTLVFSLEMPSDEWVDRLISDQGGISQERINAGELREPDWDRAAKAIEQLRTAPVTIYDSLKTLDQIVAKTRQWKSQNPAGALVMIDYLQLIQIPKDKSRNREQEVAHVSTTLYNLGKELDVAMIELCQVNEWGDPRESKQIENDCTAFWQVLEDLDEHGNVKNEQQRWVWVKKQRHGARNKRIPFTFLGDLMRFTEEPEGPDEPTLIDVPAQSTRKGARRGGAD